MKPVLIVIAGPSSAGTTTVTKRLRKVHRSDGATCLNPDEIAQERFGDWNDPSLVLKAANWAAQERGHEALLVARCTDGRLRKSYGTPPPWAMVSLANLERHPDHEQV